MTNPLATSGAFSINTIRKYSALAVLITLLTALIAINQPGQITSAHTPSGRLAAANAPCVPASGNMVQNGSFEAPGAGSTGNFDIYAPGTLGAWVVNSGSVGVTTRWQNAAGLQALDLAGNSPGSIYQDICTIPGAQYQLDFAFAGNPLENPTLKTMEVWWNGQKIATPHFNTTGYTNSTMGWVMHTYTVQATSTTARLQFTDTYAGITRSGPALDAVSLTIAASQKGTLYLPLLKMDAGFPLAINAQAIETRPINQVGETYYSMTLVLPQTLPPGGHFYLSAAPDSIAAVGVDDELVVVLDGQDHYIKLLTNPLIVEVPRAELTQWAAAQSIRVEFRDHYGSVVGSSPVWLIWQP